MFFLILRKQHSHSREPDAYLFLPSIRHSFESGRLLILRTRAEVRQVNSGVHRLANWQQLSRFCFQLLHDLEVLLVNSLPYLLGLMLFEGSQQLFLLIGRNDVIGNFKENFILFLDMVL